MHAFIFPYIYPHISHNQQLKNENINVKNIFLLISFFLFYSMELDHLPTIRFFNTRIWQLPRPIITTECLQLFYLLNGDIFYSIQTWPPDIQQLFWKKPIGDNDTFKLLLFFIGNGC